MKKTISIEEAVTLWVLTFQEKSAFFDSELYSFLYKIRETRAFQDQDIRGFRTDSNLKKKLSEVTDYLVSNGVVKKGHENYFTIGSKSPDELEIICSLYDTGYISYLSAMRFYNLTNRIPKRIDYTAPNRSSWKTIQSKALSEKNIKDDKLGSKIFTTPYPSERIKIKSKYINVHSRSNLYTHRSKGKNVRIIDIGDLFLEMIRHPDLCGGFQHVLEIYEEMAEVLLDEIIASVEELGTDIDKSRIGFILDSHLGICDSKITEWKINSTSRGGSRKMISKDPYSEYYSEDWCISLNHSVLN